MIWTFILASVTTSIFLWIAIPYLVMNYLRKKREMFMERILENTEKRMEIVKKFCYLIDKDTSKELEDLLDDFKFAFSQIDRLNVEKRIVEKFFGILDSLRKLDEWKGRVKLWELEDEMKKLNDELNRLKEYHNSVVESHNRKCKNLIFILTVKMFNIKPMDTL